MSDFTAIGQPKPIIDGHSKITGAAQYAPDLQLPGMLHARFVPSTFAHANIKGIDVSDALAVPGVEAVLTEKDLPNIVPTSRNKLMLARGRVIFVGQPVAIVLATSETAAADGAERVWVDYEPLPAAMSIEEAMADGAALVWPEGVPKGSDDAAAHGAAVGDGEEEKRDHTNIANESSYSRGNIDQGFAESDVIVEHTYHSPMVHQTSIETHGIIAQPDPISGGMSVWTSTQSPFDVRRDVANVIGVQESDVSVKAAVIGGAFGAKFSLYDPLVALVAHTVKRPVKLILTRSEELLATNPSPPVQVKAKMGAKRDGTLVALQAEVVVDLGCYPGALGAGFVGFQLGNPYPVPHLDIRGIDVMTFKQSGGAYRAPGAPTAFFVLDTLIDEISEQLGLDSLDVRIKNCAKEGDPMITDKPWPKQGIQATLEVLKDHAVWKNRDAAKAKGHGVGIAVGGWMGGTSPAAAVCGLNRDGMVHINIGSADISGAFTSMTALAAEAFGVSADKVKIIQGDTNTSPYSTGTGGSKFVYTTGTAVVKAAQEARKQVLAIAAEEFEAAVEDLEIVDGEVRVKGLPSKTISLGTIAEKSMGFGSKYAPIHASGSTVVTDQSPGFNAQLIEVAVDQETGEVEVVNVVTAQDVGRAINPMAVEGQIMGGATQGIGWALYEAMLYDDDGQLLTGSFMDYAVPDALQAGPEFESILVEIPSEHGPFGAKGVGEPPIVPTAAAIANAIAHATGARMTRIPMTAPHVLAAIKGSNGHS